MPGMPAWPHACHRASSRTCEWASPPYPHPNPRSAPRPALAALALPGTRAHGAPAVPLAPTGEGLQATLHWHAQDFRVMEVTCRGGSVAGDWRRAAHGCAATASQTGCLPSRRADPRPRCRFYRSQYRQAVCFAVRSPQLPLCAPACGAGASRHARPWRASCASSPRRERSFEPNFIGVFKISGSWKRSAEAAAWPEIGGERHTDVPRRRVRQDVCRAEEPIPGRADALTEARDRWRTWRCLENPYAHPNSRSAPRPAARALQGTRAHGAPAVPPRPDGRGATRPPQERG